MWVEMVVLSLNLALETSCVWLSTLFLYLLFLNKAEPQDRKNQDLE